MCIYGCSPFGLFWLPLIGQFQFLFFGPAIPRLSAIPATGLPFSLAVIALRMCFYVSEGISTLAPFTSLQFTEDHFISNEKYEAEFATVLKSQKRNL